MRERITDLLQTALEPLASTIALWEGGSAAFGRGDEWSDIDMHVAVADDAVEQTFVALETVLPPVELAHRIPEPTWHGHAQKFYRFRDAPPTLLLDFVVMKESSEHRYVDQARHGTPRVLFDKAGWLQVKADDPRENEARLLARKEQLCARFDLFQMLVTKALARGDAIEAIAFYQTMTWRPLVELLRMRHAPARFDFGPRYVPHDLPAAVAERVQELAFVRDPADLRTKHAAAGAWFADVRAELG